MQLIQATYTHPPGDCPNHFTEHVRSDSMSVGTYCIPEGGCDDQAPHAQDEIYVVTRGSAKFTCAGKTVTATGGTTLFVPAFEEHHFHDITADLTVLVIFAPPYSGRAKQTGSQQL